MIDDRKEDATGVCNAASDIADAFISKGRLQCKSKVARQWQHEVFADLCNAIVEDVERITGSTVENPNLSWDWLNDWLIKGTNSWDNQAVEALFYAGGKSSPIDQQQYMMDRWPSLSKALSKHFIRPYLDEE